MSAPVLAETQFFRSVPDLPLLDGMVEIGEEAIIFDKPQGRYIEVHATVDTQATLTRFIESLPQLGWEKAGEGRFVRDGEALEIHLYDDSFDFIAIVISPVEREDTGMGK